MIQLNEALQVWGSPEFATVLKQSLMRQAAHLPLQQALTASSSVADKPVTVVVLGATESAATISVRAGIFYEGVTGGCACAGDPAPDTSNNEYCVVLLDIDRSSGLASCRLVE
jgi:hypothetical protein